MIKIVAVWNFCVFESFWICGWDAVKITYIQIDFLVLVTLWWTVSFSPALVLLLSSKFFQVVISLNYMLLKLHDLFTTNWRILTMLFRYFRLWWQHRLLYPHNENKFIRINFQSIEMRFSCVWIRIKLNVS